MVDQVAVSRLKRALHSLSSNGKISGDYGQVWDNGTVDSLKNLVHWSKSPFVVSEARSTLHDLENVRSVLAGLSASLDETVMDIKKYIRPFELGKGLSSIPDELLADIFILGGYDDHSISSKETLSLACRRFRRVVLDTPGLWSRIKRDDKLPYVRACLERSKSVGLSIYLTFGTADYGLDHELSLLAEFIPHSSRWEHLNVSLNLKDLSIGDREKIFQSAIFANLHLLSLQTLELHCYLFPGEGDILANDRIKHFYQSWDMPNLHSFGTSILPKPFIAPNLSSVQLWCYHFTGSPTSGERLRDFLIAFPDLIEMNIELSLGNGQVFLHSSAIVMPRLGRLRISSYSCGHTDIRSFMGALQAPVLRRVEIEMFAREPNNDHDAALDDFFPHEDYPALEDLTLKIKADSSTKLRVPFKKFRRLRSLSLDTPSLVPYIPYMDEDDGDELVPALRTLVLTNIYNDHLQMLMHLQKSLLEQNTWHSFKQLEVSSALNMRKINTLYGEEDRNVIYREDDVNFSDSDSD